MSDIYAMLFLRITLFGQKKTSPKYPERSWKKVMLFLSCPAMPMATSVCDYNRLSDRSCRTTVHEQKKARTARLPSGILPIVQPLYCRWNCNSSQTLLHGLNTYLHYVGDIRQTNPSVVQVNNDALSCMHVAFFVHFIHFSPNDGSTHLANLLSDVVLCSCYLF